MCYLDVDFFTVCTISIHQKGHKHILSEVMYTHHAVNHAMCEGAGMYTVPEVAITVMVIVALSDNLIDSFSFAVSIVSY